MIFLQFHPPLILSSIKFNPYYFDCYLFYLRLFLKLIFFTILSSISFYFLLNLIFILLIAIFFCYFGNFFKLIFFSILFLNIKLIKNLIFFILKKSNLTHIVT